MLTDDFGAGEVTDLHFIHEDSENNLLSQMRASLANDEEFGRFQDALSEFVLGVSTDSISVADSLSSFATDSAKSFSVADHPASAAHSGKGKGVDGGSSPIVRPKAMTPTPVSSPLPVWPPTHDPSSFTFVSLPAAARARAGSDESHYSGTIRSLSMSETSAFESPSNRASPAASIMSDLTMSTTLADMDLTLRRQKDIARKCNLLHMGIIYLIVIFILSGWCCRCHGKMG
ncbi:hypothetical protein EON65_59430 [archaeon]|nr:MAG: hypothetical protein EON65_59430 [archaeon]